MTGHKNYRENMGKMNKKQLREQYSKARRKILSFDNSVEMLNVLAQFEYAIIYLDKLDNRENNKQIITKFADLNAKFKRAEPYLLMLLQRDLTKNLKMVIEKEKNKRENNGISSNGK